jgi:putative cell wall-binding protein
MAAGNAHESFMGRHLREYRSPAVRRRLAIVVLTSVAALVPAVASSASPQTVVRHAGVDRYATAAAISAATFAPGVTRAIVATGATPWDALAGAPLKSPTLLVTHDDVPSATASELDRLRPAEIVVLGGTDAVSDMVAVELQAHTAGHVRRIAGADRYATAAAISRTFVSAATPPAAVLLASGESFADALAAGSTAAPVLLTAPGALPDVTRAELDRLHPGSITILGGTAAVSDAVVAAADPYTDGPVGRLAGADRYETSAGIARYAYPSGASVVWVATGLTPSDSIAAGAAAASTRAPLLLVPGTCVTDTVRASIDASGAATMAIAGGTSAVAPAVESLTACAPPPTPGGTVQAIGDSVMLGAKSQLQAIGNGWTVTVDAVVSRQFRDGVPLIADAAARHVARIVVHLGTNGPVSASQFDQAMQAANGAGGVVVLTIQLPNTSKYAYEASTNDVIRAGAQRWGATLVDWNRESGAHPEWLGSDGTHLTASGARAYASLVAAAL